MADNGVQWKAFVEGGVAAMIAGASTHPLDLVKVRMQLQGDSLVVPVRTPQFVTAGIAVDTTALRPIRVGPIGTGIRIIQTEGGLALFNGVSATVLRQGVYSSTRMGLYDVLKRTWGEPNRVGSSENVFPLHKKVLAGLFSGAVGAAVGNPADVAMVRMQADGRRPENLRRNYKSAADAIIRISREEGVLSLWRGCGPTVQRAMVVTASQLATYDQAKEALLANGIMRDGLGAHVTASFTAGIVASVTSNPLDVIKTRLMDMKVEPGKPAPFAGAMDCAVKTVQAEGPMALYKGFIPTVTRQGPFTMVLFIALEQIKKLTASL